MAEHVSPKPRNMNSKVLIASLVTAVASFLLGWVVYGMALKGYYDAHTGEAAKALMKDPPNMLGMIISNLAWGTLVAWALWKMGVSSAATGWMPGLILSGLVAVGFDLFMLSMMNWFSDKMVVIVDILVQGVMGAVLGAVAGAMLGMGAKKAAA